jgi:hypothetical protein
LSRVTHVVHGGVVHQAAAALSRCLAGRCWQIMVDDARETAFIKAFAGRVGTIALSVAHAGEPPCKILRPGDAEFPDCIVLLLVRRHDDRNDHFFLFRAPLVSLGWCTWRIGAPVHRCTTRFTVRFAPTRLQSRDILTWSPSTRFSESGPRGAPLRARRSARSATCF